MTEVLMQLRQQFRQRREEREAVRLCNQIARERTGDAEKWDGVSVVVLTVAMLIGAALGVVISKLI